MRRDIKEERKKWKRRDEERKRRATKKRTKRNVESRRSCVYLKKGKIVRKTE